MLTQAPETGITTNSGEQPPTRVRARGNDDKIIEAIALRSFAGTDSRALWPFLTRQNDF
jgi:hypothetical protein